MTGQADARDHPSTMTDGTHAPVLRQITTCPQPANHAIERRSQHRGRPLEYRVALCGSHHTWLAPDWKGNLVPDSGTPCGTVIDHRPVAAVLESHFHQWLGSRIHVWPGDHGGDIATTLRAAHTWLAAEKLRLRSHETHTGLTVALDHAARIAELMASRTITREIGEPQLLAVLAVAETLAASERGL